LVFKSVKQAFFMHLSFIALLFEFGAITSFPTLHFPFSINMVACQNGIALGMDVTDKYRWIETCSS